MEQIVGVSDFRISNNVTDVLKTYALGSCIGVSIYDFQAKVGGLLHIQLPTSKMDEAKAKERPAMFVDTGMELLVDKVCRLGAAKNRLIIKLAGGGKRFVHTTDIFEIGLRNYLSIKRFMFENGLDVTSEKVGGVDPVTMWLEVSSGKTFLSINRNVFEL